MMRRAAALIGAIGLAQPGQAAPAEAAQTLQIVPANSHIGYTIFALGMLPITGQFQHFAGTLSLHPDPAHPCQADISIDVASLHMEDPARQRHALAADMLAAATYPTMRFTGACAGQRVTGALTLHGTTHPLALAWQRMNNQVVGEATLRRTDYGVRGMAHLVSSTVHIKFTLALPPGAGLPQS